MTEHYDYLVRLIAIGALLMIIAQMTASDASQRMKVPIVLMIIGAIAHLINGSALVRSEGLLEPFIDLASIATPLWIWLFGRLLFENDPEPRFIYVAAGSLFAGWALNNFAPLAGDLGFYLIYVTAIVLVADLARIAWSGRADDLVEQRRIVRSWLPALVAVQAGFIGLATTMAQTSNLFDTVNLIGTLLVFITTLFAGLALLRADPDLLPDRAARPEPAESGTAQPLSASEAALHEQLMAAMKDGAYRETGLTLARLSDRLDTPGPRLRALIRQRLGHRNFSAFLNHHRIAAARTELADKETGDLPMPTIAMELGFPSLQAFNRAFHAETGTMPEEFRRLNASDSDGEAADASPANAVAGRD